MLTASWFTYSGPGRIAICRGRPRRVRGYRRFPALNPGPWFRSVDPPTYIHRYRAEVLERLDPQETWDALRALVWPAEPVLMCFERPPFSPTCWCHRRLIAG